MAQNPIVNLLEMNLSTFLLLVAWLSANGGRSPVAAQHQNPEQTDDDGEPFQFDDDTTDGVDGTLGSFIGDVCEDKCSDELVHSFCNKASNTCQCDSAHPIALNKHNCLPPLSLGDLCNHVESCSYSEPNAICAEVSKYYYKCACKADYQLTTTPDGSICTSVEKEESSLPTELPTALGIGVGLSLFAALLCLVLRLFSNARFGEPRGHYAYAGPPTISLTNASSFSGPRRSSGPGSNPTSRRQSYSMLAPSKPGSRRPSAGSILCSQSSELNVSNTRSHEQLRPTVSAPQSSAMPTPFPIVSSIRSPSRRIPVFTNVVVEENDTIEDSPEIQVIPSEPTQYINAS